MKKTILSVVVVALCTTTIFSCSNEKKGASNADSSTVALDSPKTNTTTVATSKGDVPTFSSEEVNKGLAEERAIMAEYVAAVKVQDTAKMLVLDKKYTDWAQAVANSNYLSKLKPEEVKKYNDYVAKTTKDWQKVYEDADAAAN